MDEMAPVVHNGRLSHQGGWDGDPPRRGQHVPGQGVRFTTFSRSCKPPCAEPISRNS